MAYDAQIEPVEGYLSLQKNTGSCQTELQINRLACRDMPLTQTGSRAGRIRGREDIKNVSGCSENCLSAHGADGTHEQSSGICDAARWEL